MAALRAADFQQAEELVQGPMKDGYSQVHKSIDALIQFQMDQAKIEFE